jgi:hypothetical protein
VRGVTGHTQDMQVTRCLRVYVMCCLQVRVFDCVDVCMREFCALCRYMFVEAEGPNPKSKPLLVWSNGGPGAASTYGLFAEFGPLILSDQSTKTADYNATGVPSLFYNPHAWTKAANILVLNCGGPVGYASNFACSSSVVFAPPADLCAYKLFVWMCMYVCLCGCVCVCVLCCDVSHIS